MAYRSHISKQPEASLWRTMAALMGPEAAEAARIDMYERWQAWLNRPREEPVGFRQDLGALPGSKICRECKGRGNFDGYDDDFEEYQKTDCPACDGTGFKELITLEDYA